MENHDLLTCGSWLCQALRTIPNLKRAVIIGPDPKDSIKFPSTFKKKLPSFLKIGQLKKSSMLFIPFAIPNRFTSALIRMF